MGSWGGSGGGEEVLRVKGVADVGDVGGGSRVAVDMAC